MATDYTVGSACAPGVPQNTKFKIKSALITIPATAVTGSVYQVLDIKAGWKVNATQVLMVTAGVGGTIQADVGWGESTYNNYFDVAIDLEAAAGTLYMSTPSDSAPALGGAYFASADTLDIYMHDVTSAITTTPSFYVYADIEVIF